MDEQLCLKWTSHNNALADIAFKFLEHESLVDVTLACQEEGQVHYFKAHQIILSACSPYFESVFLYNTHPHPIIFLKDVKKAELENILIFMYRGEVNVHYDRIKDVLDAAKSLLIRGLSEDVFDTDNATLPKRSQSPENSRAKKRKCTESKGEEKSRNENHNIGHSECNSPATSYDSVVTRNSDPELPCRSSQNTVEQSRDNPMDYSYREGSSRTQYQTEKPYPEDSNSEDYYGRSPSPAFTPYDGPYYNVNIKTESNAMLHEHTEHKPDPLRATQDVSVIQSSSSASSRDSLVAPALNFTAIPIPTGTAKRVGRVGHFQVRWMDLFNWLQYDKESKKMFCKFCRKWGDLIPNIRRTSFVDGSCNFRFEIVKHHDCSKSHQICVHKEEVNTSVTEYY